MPGQHTSGYLFQALRKLTCNSALYKFTQSIQLSNIVLMQPVRNHFDPASRITPPRRGRAVIPAQSSNPVSGNYRETDFHLQASCQNVKDRIVPKTLFRVRIRARLQPCRNPPTSIWALAPAAPSLPRRNHPALNHRDPLLMPQDQNHYCDDSTHDHRNNWHQKNA